MPSNEFYMRLALQEACKGLGHTSPNPAVGAIIVKDHQILSKGYHQRYGASHAEVNAIQKVKTSLKGATLFVTLEPCHHFGKTPPCVDEIIRQGFREVVIAMEDPNPKTNGQSIHKLRKAGIKVSVGVLEAQAKKLNEAFIKYITTQKPFVVAKIAQTLDGKVASRSGQSKWITQDSTRNYARKLRDGFDAILVGCNTVIKDNPQLTGHKNQKLKKIILDPELKTSLTAKLLKNTAQDQCIFVATSVAAPLKVKAFEKKGAQVMICPGSLRSINLKWLFKELVKKGITSILIEGGASTIGAALKQNVVDKFHVYIAPKILGDQAALSSVVGLNVLNVNRSIKLKDLSIQKLGDDLFVEGYVYRNR